MEEKEEVNLYDFIDDEPPSPKELAKSHDLPRDKARDFIKALTREKELDLEALAPSGDEHINAIINDPIKRAIGELEKDNVFLIEKMANADDAAAAMTGGLSASAARDLYNQNIKLLLEIKKSLVMPKQSESTNITVDIGGIFGRALAAAKETAVQEAELNKVIDV